MPRPRYRITDEDFLHAEFYLSVRIRNLRIKFARGVSPLDAQKEYDAAVRSEARTQRAKILNA